MSNTNTGGPAFPTTSYNVERDAVTQEEGMTLRDYAAIAVLPGLIDLCVPYAQAVKESLHIADLYIKVREAA